MPVKKKAKKAKMIEISIAHLSQGIKTIKVRENSTIEEVLEQAEVKGGDVYLNGEKSKMSMKVKEGDIIGIVTKVDVGR
jgi:hypothetical protein